MDLDWKIAQAALRIRTMEKALHDEGIWWMTTSESIRYSARRVIESDRIIFRTNMPLMVNQLVYLYCEDDLVSVRDFEILQDGTYSLEWDFSLAEVRV